MPSGAFFQLFPFTVSTNTAMRGFPKRMTYAVVSIRSIAHLPSVETLRYQEYAIAR